MFFKRKNPTESISDINIEEVARTTLYNRQSGGWSYRDGVIEEAVRRARNTKTKDELIDAIQSVFEEYELLRFAASPCGSFMSAFEHLGVLGCEAA